MTRYKNRNNAAILGYLNNPRVSLSIPPLQVEPVLQSHFYQDFSSFFFKPTRCVSHKSRFPSCCSRLSLLVPHPRTPVPPSEGARSKFGTSSHLPYGNIEQSSSCVNPSRSVFTQKKKSANPTAPPACAAKHTRSLSTRGINNNNPLLKRIAQADLPAVAQSWQNLCVVSGGARPANNDPCVELAGIHGISSLLANADACAQQNNADAMIDFAKSPGIKNEAALIANAVAYRKHPRNALTITGVVPSTLFCEKAPRNPELNGVVNAQLQGVNPGLFGSPSAGIVPFGQREFLFIGEVCRVADRFSFYVAGTCPFGQTPDVATCSCH